MKKILKLSKNNGGLLLEALLAVVILSVSLTLIIQAMTSSLRATVYTTDYSTALLLMENKLVELMLMNAEDISTGDDVEFAEPNERFQYSVATSDLSTEEAEGVNNVTMEVSWKSGSRNNNVVVETYVLEAGQ